jgi:hypothetical protein
VVPDDTGHVAGKWLITREQRDFRMGFTWAAPLMEMKAMLGTEFPARQTGMEKKRCRRAPRAGQLSGLRRIFRVVVYGAEQYHPKIQSEQLSWDPSLGLGHELPR